MNEISKVNPKNNEGIDFYFDYDVGPRLVRVESDGAHTTHVRSALDVTNDISFGCLENKTIC